MRNKRLLRTLSALCLTLVLASGFTVPAFAQGAAPPPAEDTTNDSNVVVEETEKAPPLTPDGNAALVDDFGGNKQLITVTTKAGMADCRRVFCTSSRLRLPGNALAMRSAACRFTAGLRNSSDSESLLPSI